MAPTEVFSLMTSFIRRYQDILYTRPASDGGREETLHWPEGAVPPVKATGGVPG
jgi:hypothetical protein